MAASISAWRVRRFSLAGSPSAGRLTSCVPPAIRIAAILHSCKFAQVQLYDSHSRLLTGANRHARVSRPLRYSLQLADRRGLDHWRDRGSARTAKPGEPEPVEQRAVPPL